MSNIKNNASPLQEPASSAACATVSSADKSHVRAAFAANEPGFSEHKSTSTSTEVQIQKLIARLRLRPHHTHELRSCGISHPSGRVQDLLKRGYEIETARITSVDSDSFVHRNVALYTLVAEPAGSAA